MQFTKDGKFNLQYDLIHQVIKDTALAILNDGKQRTLRISTSQNGINGNIIESFGVVRNIVGTKTHTKVTMEPSNVRKLIEEHISLLEGMGYGTDINVLEVVLNAFNEHIAARARYNHGDVKYFGNVFIELGFPQENDHYICINVDQISRVNDLVVANRTHTIRLYQQITKVTKVVKKPKDPGDNLSEMK